MRLPPLLLLLGLNSLFSGVARAHPESVDAWGHQLSVSLQPEAARIELTVEVPRLRAEELAAAAVSSAKDVSPAQALQDFDQGFRDELTDQLRVEIDGAAVPLEPVESAPVAEKDPRFVVWRVTLDAPLPAGPASLAVTHGAWPVPRAVYRSEVWVDDGVHLLDSSLIERRSGRLVSVDGMWRPDPSLRELALRVERRRALSARAHHGWRWLTTPAEIWSRQAAEIEVIEGARPGLRRLTSRAADRGWRAWVSAALLGLGGALLPGSAAGVAAWTVPRRRLPMVAVGLAGVGALARLLALTAVPASAHSAVAATGFATAAVLAWRGGRAWLPALLAASVVPLGPVAEALPVAQTLMATDLLLGFSLGAGLGLAAGSVLLGLLRPDRIPPGILSLALIVVAGIHCAYLL